jgi:rhamnogalacturonan endolyase
MGHTKTGTDNGRGLAADIDANYDGYEMWSTGGTGTYSATGTQISTSRGSVNFRIYWDGDLYDEYLDGTTIAKWNGSKASTLLELSNYPSGNVVVSNNTTKANPSLVADLFGDWREEAVFGTTNADSLIIFTTTH